ncbi:MAG TPA: hypothetical protein VIY86_13780, partial [Pirellulaceae bacterium]
MLRIRILHVTLSCFLSGLSPYQGIGAAQENENTLESGNEHGQTFETVPSKAHGLRIEPVPAIDLGKTILLISGDEEYRSEEALPMLAGILARRHGFSCEVLFAQDETGVIDPRRQDRIPGIDSLDVVDLVIVATRFRRLPAKDMRHWDAYLRSGRPVIGLRTATHAFQFPTSSRFARYSYDSAKPGYDGGFGRVVLGETWI